MIRFRPAAQRELVADFRHYERDYPGRGRRFVEAVDVLLAQIESAPTQFAVLYEPGIRSGKVRWFPYRVVYVVVEDVVEVIAVAHAKRRPAYWRRRLR